MVLLLARLPAPKKASGASLDRPGLTEAGWGCTQSVCGTFRPCFWLFDRCTDKVLDTYSGWCECQPAEEGKGSVIHAVRSAKRNPIGKEYTCEEECKNPTWVPAISTLDMAETSANFDTIGNEDVLKHDQGAVCEKGFYDIEHLPVGAVGPLCVNLQSDLSWDMSGGAKAPPASKLCAKR